MAINIKIVDKYDEEIFKNLVDKNLKSQGIFLSPKDVETTGDEEFEIKRKKINIAAFDGENLIGLSTGESVKKNRFSMQISLVEKEYRGRGIYQEMLKLMLKETKGFDEIESNHQLFNNKIIAIKLKYGFHIIGIEQSIFVGPRITMRLYNNKNIYDLMRFRVGLIDKSTTV